MEKRFDVRHDGAFVANIYGDRIELPKTQYGCWYIWRGEEIVAGIDAYCGGVQVFDEDGKEILCPQAERNEPSVPLVDDAQAVPMVTVEGAD